MVPALMPQLYRSTPSEEGPSPKSEPKMELARDCFRDEGEPSRAAIDCFRAATDSFLVFAPGPHLEVGGFSREQLVRQSRFAEQLRPG